jgi:hypothetical protein
MTNSDEYGPEVVRYLRSIDAKLDRLNKQLEDFLSAAAKAPKGKGKRAAKVLYARTPEEAEKLRTENPDAEVIRYIVAGTPEEAEELQKKNPDALVINTGVPRKADSFVRR